MSTAVASVVRLTPYRVALRALALTYWFASALATLLTPLAFFSAIFACLYTWPRNSTTANIVGSIVMIIALPAVFMFFAISFLQIGRCLWLPEPRGLCTVIAILTTFLYPIGTVLGAITILALLNRAAWERARETVDDLEWFSLDAD
jgi:hypothetical protein